MFRKINDSDQRGAWADASDDAWIETAWERGEILIDGCDINVALTVREADKAVTLLFAATFPTPTAARIVGRQLATEIRNADDARAILGRSVGSC